MDSKLEQQFFIQKNMENYWKHTAKTVHLSCSSSNGYLSTYTNFHDALLNSVLSVQYHSQTDNEILKTINSSYTERNLPYCFWVFPNAQATLLAKQLTLNGMHFHEIIEGMAMMNLSSINYSYTIPKTVSIKQVKTQQEFNDWIKPLITSFELTTQGAEGYKNIFQDLAIDSEQMSHYIAYQNKIPVSSCSIFLDEELDAASVYNCGTVPEARKQGISTALVKHGLFDANQKGYNKAFLQATHFSKDLFAKIGFESCTPYQLFVSLG